MPTSSSLLLRSLFLLSFIPTLTLPAFVYAEEEVDALPVTFEQETLTVQEGNTAFIRLSADDIDTTTRVRVRITPDTARSGTDYRNPGVVTVTFYKNGVKSKRIGVRTINRSGTQGERSFTASIISVNGKAVPQDLETLDVTVVDRGTTTAPRTTTGATPSPVATKPVTTTSATPGKPAFVEEDCNDLGIPAGYTKDQIQKFTAANSGGVFAHWLAPNQRVALLPANTISIGEYTEYMTTPQFRNSGRIGSPWSDQEFSQELRRRGGWMVELTSFELRSAAPVIANALPGCENTPLGCKTDTRLGHWDTGLVDYPQFKVALSHCPGKMNARCTITHAVGGETSLRAYQFMDNYEHGPSTYYSACVFDVNKPIYLNVQSRCFDERGQLAPCNWLHAW